MTSSAVKYDLQRLSDLLSREYAFQAFCSVTRVTEARARISHYNADITRLPLPRLVIRPTAWRSSNAAVTRDVHVITSEFLLSFYRLVPDGWSHERACVDIVNRVDKVRRALQKQTEMPIAGAGFTGDATPALTPPNVVPALVRHEITIEMEAR